MRALFHAIVLSFCLGSSLLLGSGCATDDNGGDGALRDGGARDARPQAGDAASSDSDAASAGDGGRPDAGDGAPAPDGAPVPDQSGMPPPPPARPPAGLAGAAATVAACSGPLEGAAAVLCVDGSASGAELGTAAAPYHTIGAAVAAAKGGDAIQVAAGTYVENVVAGAKPIALRGGFATGFATRAAAAQLTTIAGAGSGPVVTFDQAPGAELDGFRIIAGTGRAVDSELTVGGGVVVDTGQVTIAHNLIEDNGVAPAAGAEFLGGGLYARAATVTLQGNVIRNNKAGRGGGVAIDNCTIVIAGNDVTGNTATSDHGGGIYASGPTVKIHGNHVSGNVVGSKAVGAWGGGILVYGSGTVAELRGDVITGNSASLAGSGVFIDDGALATLRNELIYANLCPAHGGAGLYVDGLGAISTSVAVEHCTIATHACAGQTSAVLVEAPATVKIANSILWGNGGNDFHTFGGAEAQIAVSYSITEEPIAGVGNLNVAPLFAAPQNNDYHLSSTRGRFDPAAAGGQGAWFVDAAHSPAIDAADPAAPVADEPQPNGGRGNLGAYGTTAEASLSAQAP